MADIRKKIQVSIAAIPYNDFLEIFNAAISHFGRVKEMRIFRNQAFTG